MGERVWQEDNVNDLDLISTWYDDYSVQHQHRCRKRAGGQDHNGSAMMRLQEQHYSPWAAVSL